MKKFNLFAIGVVAMLMAAVNVSAADTTSLVVTNITNADTLGNSACSATSNTVSCTSAVFKTIGAGEDGEASEGRPAGYAWIGARISVSNADEFFVNGKKYTAAEDFYYGFNLDNVKAALEKGETKVSKELTVTWTHEEEGVKTEHNEVVTLEVDITDLTLTEGENKTPVWDDNHYDDYVAENPLVTISLGSDSVTINNKVSTDTIKFRVEKGTVLDKAALDKAVNKYLVDNGYALDAYYEADGETAYDFTHKVNADYSLKMLVKAGTTEPTPADPEPTDPTPTDPTPVDPTPSNPSTSDPAENPDTLDNVTSVAAMGGISLAIAAAGIATLKKREN